MSKDKTPQTGSVQPSTDPRRGPITPTNSRVLMIDLEDATDDEITSGMSTPTTTHFPTTNPIAASVALPCTVSLPTETRIPSGNNEHPPVVPVVAPRRAFVTAVRIPVKKHTENPLSVDSTGISMVQRVLLEEALIYKQHVAKRMRESLAERLNLSYNRVTQWYLDHGEREFSIETVSPASPVNTITPPTSQNTTTEHFPDNTTTQHILESATTRHVPEIMAIQKIPESTTTESGVDNTVSSNKRQHSPESDDLSDFEDTSSSSDDDGQLGSSTWYQNLATPTKVSRPKAVDTSPGYFVSSLRTADVTRQLAPLLRGGAIVNVNDVKQFATLMSSTREMEGKRIFLNALRITGSPVVLKAFIRSNGSTTMQTWLRDAVEELESPSNRDLVLQCIRILSKLPFDSIGLSDTIFGRIIQKLTTRATSDPTDEISQEATKLKDKWTNLVMEDGKSTSASRQSRGLRKAPTSPTTTAVTGFEGFQGLSGLPKFAKKPSEPAAIEKSKPKIRVNTSFFDELKASAQQPSEPPKKKQFAVRSEGKPTHARPIKRSTEITTPPRSPIAPSPTTRNKRDRDEDLAQEGPRPRSDTISMPTRMSMPSLTLSQRTKSKKTVRFKSGDELVSIREIESRYDQSDSDEHDMGSDVEQDYHHDYPAESEMPYPLEDDSVMSHEIQPRQEFNLPGDQIAALARGDFWYSPPLVSLEGIDVVRSIVVSTEYDYQARRELFTPPAKDNAPMAIQLSPLEPTSPTSPTDFMDTRTMPLYEADSTDHAPELIQALQVVLQFLSPPAGNGGVSSSSKPSGSLLPAGQQ